MTATLHGDSLIVTSKGLFSIDTLSIGFRENPFQVFNELRDPVTAVVDATEERPLFRVTFSNGSFLDVSDQCQFVTVVGGVVGLKKLTNKTKIRLSTRLTHRSLESVSAFDKSLVTLVVPTNSEAPAISKSQSSTEDQSNFEALVIEPVMTREDAIVLGWITGAGHTANSRSGHFNTSLTSFGYSTGDAHIGKAICKYFKRKFGATNDIGNKFGDFQVVIGYYSKEAANYFTRILKLPEGTTWHKHIPNSIMAAPLPIRRAYLQSLLSSRIDHGRKFDKTYPLSFPTVSEDLARQVQQLLFSFGVTSTLEKLKESQYVKMEHCLWRINLTPLQVAKYVYAVGFLPNTLMSGIADDVIRRWWDSRAEATNGQSIGKSEGNVDNPNQVGEEAAETEKVQAASVVDVNNDNGLADLLGHYGTHHSGDEPPLNTEIMALGGGVISDSNEATPLNLEEMKALLDGSSVEQLTLDVYLNKLEPNPQVDLVTGLALSDLGLPAVLNTHFVKVQSIKNLKTVQKCYSITPEKGHAFVCNGTVLVS